MIIEITILQLPADVELEKSHPSVHEVVHSFLTQKLAGEGARYAYFGQSSEKPNNVFIFVGWDTLQSSEKFASSPNGKNALASLRGVASAEEDITVLHIPFKPSDDPSQALGADSRVGVTEIVLYHFPSPLTDKADVMESMDQMRPVINRSEALAVYDGWALENKRDEKGEMSEICFNAVGWVDVDAHMRFQASEDFKQNIHHLLDIKSLRQLEMHHIRLHRV